MKSISFAAFFVALFLVGCDSSSDDISRDDVLSVINSLDIPDISFRYKYVLEDKTITLDSDTGPGSTTRIDVDLVEGNIFNFWVNISGFSEAFKQCSVGAGAPDLGAVRVMIFTSSAGTVIECGSNGNWAD